MTRRSEAAAALGLYAALFAAWGAGGEGFLIFDDLWQLLPWPALLHDLARSLLDLHAQPPLLNLILGLALKAGEATGTRPAVWLLGAHFAAGAASVLAIVALARRLIARPSLRWCVVALFLAHPYFYAALYFFFYTAWETAFLCLAAALALRFFDRPTAARAAGVLAPACLLVCTRSLFHPAWLALVAGSLAAHARRCRETARSVAAVAFLAVLLAAAWPAKNWVRFGFAGTSSWSGYNFARGLPVERPVAMSAFERGNESAPPPGAAAAAAAAVPPSLAGRPALADLAKPGGAPNWNHFAVIEASREMGAEARRVVARAPWLLALRALDYYLNGYAIFEGRHVYSGSLAREIEAMPSWARAYELVSVLPFARYDPTRTRLTTGFALLLPPLLAAVAAGLWRRRRTCGSEDRAAALMLFCVLWVLGMALFVDGAEGNRMRFCTQPFLLLLAGRVLDRLLESRSAAGRLPEAL